MSQAHLFLFSLQTLAFWNKSIIAEVQLLESLNSVVRWNCHQGTQGHSQTLACMEELVTLHKNIKINNELTQYVLIG